MNEKDNESTNKAVDALINFGKALHLKAFLQRRLMCNVSICCSETVKYFCNEQHEAQRFERALDGKSPVLPF